MGVIWAEIRVSVASYGVAPSTLVPDVAARVSVPEGNSWLGPLDPPGWVNSGVTGVMRPTREG